jgi:maltooligosyltrehalose trehalohydrolase
MRVEIEVAGLVWFLLRPRGTFFEDTFMNSLSASVRSSHFGPVWVSKDEIVFQLFAPACTSVTLDLDGDRVPMEPQLDGWFEIQTRAEPGMRYCFVLPDGMEVPDPAARAQAPDDATKSLVVDPSSYKWRMTEWKGRPWHEMVIYELHVGLFGGFNGVTSRLSELASYGITAVELMPVADFEGRHNWGYDGALLFAPAAAYGTPDELKRLIDTAHSLNICVFLDVVYNHFGPRGNFLPAYAGSFFRDDVKTPWGSAIDFRNSTVRDFYFDNARYWLEEFRFDGLRFDAVHAIEDAGWLSTLPGELRAALPEREIHLILENDHNDTKLIEAGYNAQWNDDLHHVMHVLLTGESDGYYQDYADQPAEKLARALAEGFIYQGEPSMHHGGEPRGMPSAGLSKTSFVGFLQNHDQVGNRAFGDRLATLTSPEQLDAALTLLLLAPHIPMLFMGEEVKTTAPFNYFADYEGELADSIREGRRLEFEGVGGFGDSVDAIPDPISEETFRNSRVNVLPRASRNAETLKHTDLVRTLLVLRHQTLIPRLEGCKTVSTEAIGSHAVFAEWCLSDGSHLCMFVNLGQKSVVLASTVRPDAQTLFESSDGASDNLRNGSLSGASAVVWIEPANVGRARVPVKRKTGETIEAY